MPFIRDSTIDSIVKLLLGFSPLLGVHLLSARFDDLAKAVSELIGSAFFPQLLQR